MAVQLDYFAYKFKNQKPLLVIEVYGTAVFGLKRLQV
jgi:hypothetical protein